MSRKNAKSSRFGKWFKKIIDSYPEIKKKNLAEKAGISAVSLSRILTGEHGVSEATAESLMNTLNELTGSKAVDVHEGLRILSSPHVIPKNLAVKIKGIFSKSDLPFKFSDRDFQWFAEIIEMRLLWNDSQSSNRDLVSENEDFFVPPTDDNSEEPDAVDFYQISNLEQSYNHSPQIKSIRKAKG